MIRKALLSFLLVLATAASAIAASQSAIPPKFGIPWGNSAGAAYLRSIPQSSQIGIQNCAASLTDGFPPLTFVPVAAGGCPPFGADFNGILNQTSAWARWLAMGGQIPWDSAFSTTIGGYPINAVVPSSTTAGVWWQSSVDNNTSNPDTGGGNWNGVGYLPTGSIVPFAGSTAPPGFVLAAGQSLLRASFVALFAVIGTTYGAADGTHFNVPDLRGRTVYAADAMGGTPANRITSGGSGCNAVVGTGCGLQNETLTQAQLPAITPTWTPTTQTWNINQGSIVTTQGTAVAGGGGAVVQAPTSNTISVTVTPNGTIGGFSGLLGQSHPILAPGLIASYIIKL